MPLNPETTFITVKVLVDGTNRRFKIALRDLGANVFPAKASSHICKLRFLLAISPDAQVTFERYSDSAATYVTLDSNNPAIYKQLYRAAKAKLKLRIKATVVDPKAKQTQIQNIMDTQVDNSARPRSNYLETVMDTAPAAPSTAEQVSQPKINLAHMFGLPNTTSETLVTPPKTEETKSSPAQPLMCERFSQSFLPSFHDFPTGVFCIDCNYCGRSIPNEHYHCSICDDGDYDLCQACVDDDIVCGGEGHWLIKRKIENGQVVSSTTETIAPVKAKKVDPQPVEPVALVEPVSAMLDFVAERTCNGCIGEFANTEFVTCQKCYDFDLCHSCLLNGHHGHNPAHNFVPLEESVTKSLDPLVRELCKPGRNIGHMAICDGCDQKIKGIRHKCLNCPDWDYCSSCVTQADKNHHGHRFAPLYDPIAEITTSNERHFGIYCDGALCKDKPRRDYIRGIRYKCAVCHDTDFCANCEAAPNHQHNRTHPLIMFKTPVRHVSVTTLGEKPNGEKMARMGDNVPKAKNAATETVPAVKSTNAATQVQTMVDFKPVPSQLTPTTTITPELDAIFVSETIPDGSIVICDTAFTQTWTMSNPGPSVWPMGCSVRFVGGDAMLNIDSKHPSPLSAISNATSSNTIEAPVQAGESIAFTVTLKAPSRIGRAISYWRLKSADGKPFGHKLWCDVNVMPEIKNDWVPKGEMVQQGITYVSPSVKEEDSVKSEESSTMIFPKLEKESPVSSIHEMPKNVEVAETPTAAPTPKSVDSLIEDVESLELDDVQSEADEDEGFLTDEEYDILDASDEEFLAESQNALKK